MPILKRSQDSEHPGYLIFGAGLLLLAFVTMLAGRFNLERLSKSLPSIDIRMLLIYSLALLFMVWWIGSREHVKPVAKMPVMLAFGAWAVWLMASTTWVTPEAKVVEEITDMVAMVAIVGFSTALINRLPAEVTSRVWKWTLVAGLIYLVLAVADGPDLQGRYAAPGGGPNVFARVMVLAAMAALYVSIAKRRTWPLLTVPLFAAGAALSGSRGGVLSAGLVVLLCFWPLVRRLGLKKITVMVVGFAGIAWLGALLSPKTATLITKMIEQRFYKLTFVEQYSSGRDGITERAIEMYESHREVGAGIGGYYAKYPDDGYPHNLLLSTAAEAGNVGLVLLLIALIWFFFATVTKTRPLSLSAFFALAAGIYLFVTSLFSGDYYDSRLMWFFLALAVVEAARPKVIPSPTVR